MRFILRIFRYRPFRVSFDKVQCGFLYRERGRRMRVSGEEIADGYAVYSSSIRQWESLPAESIDEKERLRIVSNIRDYLVDRGRTVYIS